MLFEQVESVECVLSYEKALGRAPTSRPTPETAPWLQALPRAGAVVVCPDKVGAVVRCDAVFCELMHVASSNVGLYLHSLAT